MTKTARKQQQKPDNRLIDDANVVVAIPIFNELEYVDEVLSSVGRYASNILVIDDGSNDGTEEQLSKYDWIERIKHQTNVGYGRSLIDAFDYAAANGYDWIVTMDCDYQHQPLHIRRFIEQIALDDADIISGSRYLDLSDVNSAPPDRAQINKKVTAFLNRHLEIELTDSFCGFKAYRTSALARLRLTENGYGLPLQLWIQAARTSMRIREIPVPLIYNDPSRSFNGDLNDPQKRLKYYISIINREFEGNGYQ